VEDISKNKKDKPEAQDDKSKNEGVSKRNKENSGPGDEDESGDDYSE
jgi:hypothetical protein